MATSVKDKKQERFFKRPSDKDRDRPRLTFDPLRLGSPQNKEDEAQLFGMIRTEADRRLSALRGMHSSWTLYSAFVFMLNSWAAYAEGASLAEYEELAQTWGYVSPQIFNSVRYIISRMSAQQPRIGFVPKFPTSRSIRTARTAEKFLEYCDTANETEIKELQHAHNLAVLGTTIGEVYMHEKAKELAVPVGDKKDPTKTQMKRVSLPDHRIINPRGFFPDPLATNLEDCRNVIRRDLMPLDTIYNLWGITAQPASENEIAEETDIYNEYGQFFALRKPKAQDVGFVYSTYITGGEDEPRAEDGRLIIAVSDRVATYDKGALENGALPFFYWRYMVRPTDFWGVSYVRQQVPAAKVDNILKTITFRSALSAMSERWGLEQGSSVDWEDFYASGEQVTHYEYSGEPPHNSAQDIKYIGKDIEHFDLSVQSDLQLAAATHDVTLGRGDPDAGTLGEVEILEEKDAVSLETAVRERKRAYRRKALMQIAFQKEFGEDEVLTAAIGKHQPYDRLVFRKSDLTDELDAYCYPESGRPRTEAARLRGIERAMGLGFIDPQIMDQDSKMALANVYGDTDSTEIFKRVRRHEAIARTENAQLALGVRISPSVGHLHDVHLPIHWDQYFDEEWQTDPNTTERVVLFQFDHIMEHLRYRKEHMDSMQTEQMATADQETLKAQGMLKYPHGEASFMQSELRQLMDQTREAMVPEETKARLGEQGVKDTLRLLDELEVKHMRPENDQPTEPLPAEG